tara:strand:- start:300 stop:623 length:324 start_codon:yes stop_codon:yes gene_type:complete
MATLQHNISGELTTVLVPQGDNVNVNSMTIANTHASLGTHVDVYIGTISKNGKASTTYYLCKGYLLHKGGTLTLNPKFSNTSNGFGLFIKLTGVATTSPTVDVIISR